jgi:ubiquinone/menaquinone biosynthesis C-methylase UbiE
MKLPRLVRQIGKRIVKAAPILRRHILASTDYRVLSGSQEARDMTTSSSGWHTARTVMRQERAYEGLIAAMKHGKPRLDLSVAAEAIAATAIPNPQVIEIGCGSGYYSDVFATLLPGGVRYTGIDYSDAMIARARVRYPSATFEVGDATRMKYADHSYDIVFNGVSLMHIVDYQAAIREAARVASRYCIFHSVPIFHDYGTTFFRKYAYGAPVVEVVFSRQEFMALCGGAGLRLEREWNCIPYDVSEVTGHPSTMVTCLFSIGGPERR